MPGSRRLALRAAGHLAEALSLDVSERSDMRDFCPVSDGITSPGSPSSGSGFASISDLRSRTLKPLGNFHACVCANE